DRPQREAADRVAIATIVSRKGQHIEDHQTRGNVRSRIDGEPSRLIQGEVESRDADQTLHAPSPQCGAAPERSRSRVLSTRYATTGAPSRTSCPGPAKPVPQIWRRSE